VNSDNISRRFGLDLFLSVEEKGYGLGTRDRLGF